MFSDYTQSRDEQGREVIEIRMDTKRAKATIIALPVAFSLVIGFAMQFPLLVIGAMLIFLTAAFAVIAFPHLESTGSRWRLRVTLDKSAGKILLASESGESEILMAEVARAEFGSTISTHTSSDGSTTDTTIYRLEFVKKSGERVPANATYTNLYSSSDQERLVASINAALRTRMV